jgi:tRNA pseudouridine55 synthase
MDGILVLCKPPGPTSHDVVGLVRRLTGAKRVGHGGTLDPFASGVLPVFVGLATRLVEYHMGDDKAYRATICFGATSPTDDRDGELTPGNGPAPRREAVAEGLAGFRGVVEQRPPAYSALKVGGRRAYRLAREGQPAELPLRQVEIRRLELVDWDDSDAQRPVAVLEVECGAGTYVRSIARDLGERLGCGAYLGALIRTRSGPFRIEASHDLDELRAAATEGADAIARLALPIDAGLEAIPIVTLSDAEVTAAARGQQVKPSRRPTVEAGTVVRLLDERNGLVGMGSWKTGRIVPEKIFVAPPAAAPRVVADTARAADATRPVSRPRPAEPRLRVVPATGPAVVVPGIEALTRDTGRIYAAVGVFDGLHRGHLYLLRALRDAAVRAGARPAVITFDAHPEQIVLGLAPPLLCDPDERLVRLIAAGMEVTVVQHFDESLRKTAYRDFVQAIRSRVELAGFVMTPDAAFGYERQGTPETLAALGQEEGFGVTVVPSLLVDGQQVTSSEIRRRVEAGDLAEVRRLLGRPLAVTGEAVGSPGSSGVRIQFPVPVALPPAGRHPVLVGAAWAVGSPHEPARREAVAVVGAGSLELEGVGDADRENRLRVVFVGEAGPEQHPE